MTYDWMHEPESGQVPATSLQDRERLEALKELAERENQAASEAPVAIPNGFVTSLSALRAQRATASVGTAPPAPVTPTPAPAPVAQVSAGLQRAVASLSEATLALKAGEPLSDDVIGALTNLGIALDVPQVFDRLLEGFNEQREVAPEDRYGAISLALDLRAQRVSWREATERVNAAGYRNTNGEPWKLWALRRTCIRFAERRGEVIATTRKG